MSFSLSHMFAVADDANPDRFGVKSLTLIATKAVIPLTLTASAVHINSEVGIINFFARMVVRFVSGQDDSAANGK